MILGRGEEKCHEEIAFSFVSGAIALGAVAAASPSSAMPLHHVPNLQAAPDGVVTQVQDRRGFYRRGGSPYYNGHRGYRDERPGYRYHEGYWFPGGAFVAGAIIGGALAAQPPYRPRYYEPAPRYYEPPPVRYYEPAPRRVVRSGDAHVRWCYSQYRSYREWDNTFQPYGGPRRECRSPYY